MDYVNAIELQEFKLWKVDKQERKELDMGVLNLLLSLTDERSELRDYTIKPETANIPQKGQILKSRVGNIVTDKFLEEQMRKDNSALKKTLREKDCDNSALKKTLREKDK